MATFFLKKKNEEYNNFFPNTDFDQSADDSSRVLRDIGGIRDQGEILYECSGNMGLQ